MKIDRITITSMPNARITIVRKPFDLTESCGFRQCWVRYRGGRLFVASLDNGLWRPLRFEPKNGNAYSV